MCAILPLIWTFCACTLYAQPKGFRLGRFNLSPQLKSNFGMNSNPLFASSTPSADGFFIIEPRLVLAGKYNRFALKSEYNFTRLQYFNNPLQNSNGHNFDLTSEISSYRWRIETRERFQLTTDPADAEILERVRRRSNTASALFSYFTPSKDLEVNLKYTNNIRWFDGDLSALNSFRDLVIVSSKVNVSSLVRFLPKTAITSSFQYNHTTFPNADPSIRSKADGIAISVGLNGKITPKLSAQIETGYSMINFDAGPNSKQISSKAILIYDWHALGFKLGYSRINQAASFTNFFNANTLFYDLNWKSRSNRYNVSLGGSVDWLTFDPASLVANGESRSDLVIRDRLHFGYYITRKCEIFTEYQLAKRSSNATNPLTGAQSSDFIQHIGSIGFVVYY
jgi:hypothetical protein